MKSLSFRKDLVGVQEELLRFAYKLTTDREEANDLLQETSLKALDNEEKYTPDTNFKGWMYTIMRNIFINNYRKVVRDQTQPKRGNCDAIDRRKDSPNGNRQITHNTKQTCEMK